MVEQWSENNYYQYFCGMQAFLLQAPYASSELVHFRNRIGQTGIELIFKESIRINGNKVSILYPQTTGVIVGALAFANPYDGHTLDAALETLAML